MHVRAARTNGLSVDEIGEVILQAAVYCGVPAANHAFAIAPARARRAPRRTPVPDVFVYDAVRTPFGRFGGALAGTRPDDLAALVVGGLLERHPDLDRERIGEVLLGNANGAGEDNRNVARMAVLLAGLPVVGARVDGQPALRLLASTPPSPAPGRSRSARPTSSWSAGSSRCRARRGCCRSRSGRSRPATPSWCRPRSAGGWSTPRCPAPGRSRSARRPSSCASARACPARTRTRSRCGRTSSRRRRGTAASTTTRWSPSPGSTWPATSRSAPTPPPTSSPASSRCSAPTAPSPPATPRRSTTAPRRRCSGRPPPATLGDPLARVAGWGAAANEPQFFGFAPVEAADRALARAGIGWDDVGAVELNEAFAAQSLACVRAWGIDPEIVNAHGGAIAIGHPLGASGTRVLGTLARSLAASGERWGVAAICIGVGQGLAVVLENADGSGALMVTFVDTAAEAVSVVGDGATVMIGGFGAAGQPVELIEALLESGARDLTVVNNNAGNGDRGLAALIRERRVRKIVCSFPRQRDSDHFDAEYRAGRIELELVAQGNLAERIRAAGAGIGGVLHAHRLRHAARRGQGGARDRRSPLRPRATRSAPTSRWSRRRPPTRSATSSTARPPATSGRSWPRPPRRPSCRCASCGRSAASTPSTS